MLHIYEFKTLLIITIIIISILFIMIKKFNKKKVFKKKIKSSGKYTYGITTTFVIWIINADTTYEALTKLKFETGIILYKRIYKIK